MKDSFAFILPLYFEALNRVNNLVYNIFPLTDDECIDECIHGFGVHGGMAACDDDGVSLVAVYGVDRDPSEIENIECVGIKSLIGEGKANEVEAGQRSL